MSPFPAAASGAISVLVADSNRMQAQLLTNALRRRPEFRVAICPMDTASILQAVSTRPASVAVLSLNHSTSLASQIGALRQFHRSEPAIAKILLVERFDRDLVVNAFRCGARGIFCITDMHFRALCKCIQRVAGGQIWANTEQMDYLLDLISESRSLRVFDSHGRRILSPREEQVVAQVAEGFSNREIARELKLSEHTVKKYIFRIFEKLGVSTRVELVLYAFNHGDAHPGTMSTQGSAQAS
ncbi:MAG TPA: response regulator transcription factor [Candidatus Aquilonibacter sp.]|nr:response regulator transcription factor [Candidatus Aquilonibacter sp.]